MHFVALWLDGAGFRESIKGVKCDLQTGNRKNIVGIQKGDQDPGKHFLIVFLLYAWASLF